MSIWHLVVDGYNTCFILENNNEQFLVDSGVFKLVKYNASEKNTKEICDKRALKLLIDRGYFTGREFRQKEWASEYYKDLIQQYLNNN